MNPTTHVSEALVHLRGSVLTAALVTIACCSLQLLVFGFVHFTEARWEVVHPSVSDKPLAVVTSADGIPDLRSAAVRPGRKAAVVEEPQRVPSKWDARLRLTSEMASVCGSLAALGLGVFSLMGVVVAGGACLPGVGSFVSAATWSTFLGLACVPWSGFLPALPFPGVLAGYDPMAAASDSGGEGMRIWVLFVLLPFTAIVVASLVAIRFRAGVEAGGIVQSVSALDYEVEREIAAIQARGPGTNFGPRAVGTVGQAVGAGRGPVLPEPPAAVAAAMSRPPSDGTRGIGRPSPGLPQRRLI